MLISLVPRIQWDYSYIYVHVLSAIEWVTDVSCMYSVPQNKILHVVGWVQPLTLEWVALHRPNLSSVSMSRTWDLLYTSGMLLPLRCMSGDSSMVGQWPVCRILPVGSTPVGNRLLIVCRIFFRLIVLLSVSQENHVNRSPWCIVCFCTQVLFELCPKHTSAAATSGDDHHLMIINASPLEYGHSLLVPSISSCLPQVLVITVHCVWGWCASKFEGVK